LDRLDKIKFSTLDEFAGNFPDIIKDVEAVLLRSLTKKQLDRAFMSIYKLVDSVDSINNISENSKEDINLTPINPIKGISENLDECKNIRFYDPKCLNENYSITDHFCPLFFSNQCHYVCAPKYKYDDLLETCVLISKNGCDVKNYCSDGSIEKCIDGVCINLFDLCPPHDSTLPEYTFSLNSSQGFDPYSTLDFYKFGDTLTPSISVNNISNHNDVIFVVSYNNNNNNWLIKDSILLLNGSINNLSNIIPFVVKHERSIEILETWKENNTYCLNRESNTRTISFNVRNKRDFILNTIYTNEFPKYNISFNSFILNEESPGCFKYIINLSVYGIESGSSPPGRLELYTNDLTVGNTRKNILMLSRGGSGIINSDHQEIVYTSDLICKKVKSIYLIFNEGAFGRGSYYYDLSDFDISVN